MNVLQQSNCETRRWVARVPQHGEAATGAGTGSHDIIGNQGISAHYFRLSLERMGTSWSLQLLFSFIVDC